MQKSLITLALTSLLLAACGEQQAPATSTQSASGETPVVAVGGKGSISEDRSAAFKSFMPTLSKMRKMVKGDEPFTPEKFQAAAEQFSKEARVPFEYFQNDPNGNGDALPSIWANPDAFKAEQDKFLAAVDSLNAAAKTGKLDDIKVAFDAVSNSCQTCHDSHRRPK